ncbi:MAG: PAS domain S-box protein [Pyrinomonadaceae bacterium]
MTSSLRSVSHLDDVELTRHYLSQLLNGQSRSVHLEQRFIHKEGHYIWGYVSASAIHDTQRSVRHLIVQVQDFTDRKRAEEQLRHDALHDALTGLPNRTLLLDRLKLARARSRRRGGHLFAILFWTLIGSRSSMTASAT